MAHKHRLWVFSSYCWPFKIALDGRSAAYRFGKEYLVADRGQHQIGVRDDNDLGETFGEVLEHPHERLCILAVGEVHSLVEHEHLHATAGSLGLQHTECYTNDSGEQVHLTAAVGGDITLLLSVIHKDIDDFLHRAFLRLLLRGD